MHEVKKMTLGEKIIEFRKKNNLTQEKLADKIGISRQTLSNWESDITSPDIKQAKVLANIFEIGLDELTNNKIEIKCNDNTNNILFHLIGKECYLDILEDDFRLTDSTICKVLNINNNFIKVEFKYSKDTIIKMIDINLIASIRLEEKVGK